MSAYVNRNSKFILFALLIIAFAIGGCNQTEQNFDAQIAIAESGNQAMTSSDWDAYGKLMHPDALAEFKSHLMPIIENLPKINNSDTINLFGHMYVVDSLKAKDDTKFFTEFLGIIFSLSPDLATTFSTMKNESVGAILEGDNTIHALFRTDMKISGREVTEMNVVTLLKDGTEWKLDLSYKLEGILMMVKSTLEQMKA